MNKNYLIKDGTLWSSCMEERETKDILITDGIIQAIENNIKAEQNVKVLHADGMFLMPGWIDGHAHIYNQNEAIGIDADNMISSGVTCVVDAGTTGAYNFQDFKTNIIDQSQIMVKALLHIAKWGVNGKYGELRDMSQIDMSACLEMCAQYPEDILGLKVRIDGRVCSNEELAMKKLRDMGDRAGKPIVVHASRSSLPLEEILSYLKRGDIFAHTFSDKKPGILDKNGIIKEAAIDAKRRGVIFDLSHGNGNFSFDIARTAMNQGFFADMISTDLHKGSRDIVKSLSLTMTKMLHLGLSLEDVICYVTEKPAQILNIGEKSLKLKTGAVADIVGFKLQEGDFMLTDSSGKTEHAEKQIVTCFTLVKHNLYIQDPTAETELAD